MTPRSEVRHQISVPTPDVSTRTYPKENPEVEGPLGLESSRMIGGPGPQTSQVPLLNGSEKTNQDFLTLNPSLCLTNIHLGMSLRE